MPVRQFLLTHSRVRTGGGEDPVLVQQAIDFANKLTGEPIDMDNRMTELSGGQTRALLIADATVICSTPVVLLDEVETPHPSHAGGAVAPRIPKDLHFRHARSRIALLSDFRIVMQGGRVTQVLSTSEEERGVSSHVNRLDDALSALRENASRLAPQRRRIERIAGGCMRVAICAGPATTGKTSVVRHATRKLLHAGHKVAFLKLDVQYADEDEALAKEFGIPHGRSIPASFVPTTAT